MGVSSTFLSQLDAISGGSEPEISVLFALRCGRNSSPDAALVHPSYMAAASVCRLPAVVPAVAAVAPTDDMFAVGDWIHFNSAPASPDEGMSVLDGHGEPSDDTDGLHVHAFSRILPGVLVGSLDG